MAQYQPTIALGQLKGKIGSTVFQGGNNSYVIRAKGYRKGKPSQARSRATSDIVQCSTAWRNLTRAEQLTWAALAPSYPFVNKFGVTYYSNAYQVFIAYNVLNIKLGHVIQNTPAVPDVVTDLSPFSIVSLTTGAILLAPTIVAPSPQRAIVYASPPFSNGKNLNNIKFSRLQDFDAVALAAYDVSGSYNARFGILPVGLTVAFKLCQEGKYYGFLYFPSIISGIST